MSNKDDRRPAAGREIGAVSLVAMVTCALATDALATLHPADANGELSARVAAVVERINASDPALVRDLRQRRTIAWSNR
jgi:hypothetical protein